MSTSGPATAPDETQRPPIRFGLLYVVLVVAAAGVMLPALFGPFIFDDQPLILGNHYVHSFEHWARWLKGGLWDTNYDPTEGVARRGYWRPVILASYAWDWALGGGAPFVFHVTNVVVHAANVVLAFGVLQRWCTSTWGAFFGALLFAVHPVQTEPVAWIAGRTDSLCVLGMLTVVLGLRRWCDGRRGSGLPLMAVGVMLAFGSKESAITLPALVVVELWSRAPGGLTWRSLLELCVRALPFVGMALALLAIRHFTVVDTQGGDGLSASNRVPLIFEALGRYAWLLIWPADTTLGQATLYYDDHRFFRVHWGFVAAGFVALLALLGFIWVNREARPRAAMAGLLTCGLLFPVSGVVWLGYAVLVSPRFLYVPMLGITFGAGLAIEHLIASRWRRLAVGASAAAVVCLSATTFARAADFSSEQSFWRAEIEQSPHYPPAQEFFIVRELRQQRTRNALRLARHFFASNLEAGFPELYNGNLVTRIVEGILQLTPDSRRETLARVARFCQDLARGRSSALVVPEVGVNFVVSDDPSLMDSMRSRRRLLQLLAAEAASRLGDDAVALENIRELMVGCERCWTILSTSAVVQARSGDLEGALRVVAVAQEVAPPGRAEPLLETLTKVRPLYPALATGKGPLVSRYYASLGAFGRAFDAAEEAVQAPPEDEPSRLAIAELAARAGDMHAAHRLSRFPDDQFRAWVDALEPPIRWRDLEAGPDVWIPHVPER